MTKIGLRKLWFQVHKWIGLILAVLIIPISLTGAALVWHDPIDRALHADRYAVQGPGTLPATRYADAARAVLAPGQLLSKLEIPGKAGEPVVATAVDGGPAWGRPVRTSIYIDPADGHVIDKARSDAGVFPTFHQLHGSLMLPGVGRAIVGWIGVAMAFSCFTGIWLWWPTVGRWVRGLRWRRHRNFDTNLHHLFGFWIALPLFVLSLTGVWISFPQVFAGFDGMQPKAAGPDRAALFRARPLAEPATGLADIVAQAQTEVPGGAVRAVTWPTDLKPEWAVDVAGKGRAVTMTVADTGGAVKLQPKRDGQPQTLARTMRQIHDGSDMPFLWQLLVFLGGVLPAVLAVTGIIMWWRARSWRGELARRQRELAAAE